MLQAWAKGLALLSLDPDFTQRRLQETECVPPALPAEKGRGTPPDLLLLLLPRWLAPEHPRTDHPCLPSARPSARRPVFPSVGRFRRAAHVLQGLQHGLARLGVSLVSALFGFYRQTLRGFGRYGARGAVVGLARAP
eukprot:5404270-Prymnesium_polylepis.1